MIPASTLPPADYERSDASPRGILRVAAVLAIGVLVALIASAGWYVSRYRGLASTGTAGPEFSFRHGSREETGLQRDQAAQRLLVREHLETYGWTDRDAGIVRIPITRAIELMVAEDGARQPEKRP